MRKILFVIALTALPMAGVCAELPQTTRTDAACVKKDGEIGGPFVPAAVVAKKIYRAIATAIAPWGLKKYPIIVATDKGDHWSVSQTRHYPKPKPSSNPAIVTVTVTAGGGMLDLEIDKCSGAITYAAFDR